MSTRGQAAVLAIALILGAGDGARASILVDHQPALYYGGDSDTDFVDPLFGDSYWQRVADNFTLDSDSTIAHATWWGFYGAYGLSTYPPQGDETMRIRVYASRGSDGRPGEVLYEESITNPQRAATGRNVTGIGPDVPEFKFDVDLASPLAVKADTTYWFEVVQIGLPTSVFRWSFTAVNTDGQAYVNQWVPDWLAVPADVAFQLEDVPEPSIALILVCPIVIISNSRRRKEVTMSD